MLRVETTPKYQCYMYLCHLCSKMIHCNHIGVKKPTALVQVLVWCCLSIRLVELKTVNAQFIKHQNLIVFISACTKWTVTSNENDKTGPHL